MNGFKNEQIYRAALAKWGIDCQIIMAIEELSELQKALTKFLRYGKQSQINDIAEEMADVEIMLEQLELIFKLQNSITKVKREKINRLEKLIYGEQKCKI